MEPYDEEVEWALMNGIDPAEHIASLTRKQQEAEEKRVAPLLAKVLLEHMVPVERESTEAEVDLAIELGAEEEERLEREQIIEASRSVRKGTEMLFAALRKNGVIR